MTDAELVNFLTQDEATTRMAEEALVVQRLRAIAQNCTNETIQMFNREASSLLT